MTSHSVHPWSSPCWLNLHHTTLFLDMPERHDPLLKHLFHTKSQTNHFNKKLYKNLKEIHYNLEEEKKTSRANNVFFP